MGLTLSAPMRLYRHFNGILQDHLGGSIAIGNFDGVDVINILLTQEASAKFLVKKIYKEFVSEYYDEKTINSLAHILRENDYELKPLLKTIFLSKDFSLILEILQ